MFDLRLYGLVATDDENSLRSTYGFLHPFTLALLPEYVNPHDGQGGVIFDQAGVYALQFNHYLMGFPDWVFVAPSQQFNPIVDTDIIIGVSDSINTGIVGSPPNTGEECVC